jgi:hypothetical protein
MNNASSKHSFEMSPSTSVSMNELLAEYWKLAELETGLHQLYDSATDGSHKFRHFRQSLTDLLDQTAQRQSEIVEAITPLTPKTTEELKAKAQVILRCLSVEDGDVDGMLVRAVVQNLMGMTLRAADTNSADIAMVPKKRSRKAVGMDTPTTGLAGIEIVATQPSASSTTATKAVSPQLPATRQ